MGAIVCYMKQHSAGRQGAYNQGIAAPASMGTPELLALGRSIMKSGLKPLLLAACFLAGGAPVGLAQTTSSMPPAAPSSNCYMTKMSSSSGAFITLTTGLKYQVVPGAGRAAVMQWLPLDKVQVCRTGGNMYEITNLSRAKPVTVRAMRQ